MKRNFKKIKYTFLHKLAFLKIEKQLLGKNTLRGYLHDIDKLIMYCFLPTDKAHAIHVKHSRHHDKCKTHDDYVEMVIDWECARYTKADKPLNAAETLKAFYPHMKDEIAPVLEELGLIDEKWYLDDAVEDALEEGALVAEFEYNAAFSGKGEFVKNIYEVFVSSLNEKGFNGKELWHHDSVKQWLAKNYPQLYKENPEIFNIEENKQCKQ